MPDNPYQFDNDRFTRARIGLHNDIAEMWFAGAGEDLIHEVVDERLAFVHEVITDEGGTPEQQEAETEPAPPSEPGGDETVTEATGAEDTVREAESEEPADDNDAQTGSPE